MQFPLSDNPDDTNIPDDVPSDSYSNIVAKLELVLNEIYTANNLILDLQKKLACIESANQRINAAQLTEQYGVLISYFKSSKDNFEKLDVFQEEVKLLNEKLLNLALPDSKSSLDSTDSILLEKINSQVVRSIVNTIKSRMVFTFGKTKYPLPKLVAIALLFSFASFITVSFGLALFIILPALSPQCSNPPTSFLQKT